MHDRIDAILATAPASRDEWKRRIDSWRIQLQTEASATDAAAEAAASGLRAMPVRDQRVLQWTLIAAGLEQVSSVFPTQ